MFAVVRLSHGLRRGAGGREHPWSPHVHVPGSALHHIRRQRGDYDAIRRLLHLCPQRINDGQALDPHSTCYQNGEEGHGIISEICVLS